MLVLVQFNLHHVSSATDHSFLEALVVNHATRESDMHLFSQSFGGLGKTLLANLGVEVLSVLHRYHGLWAQNTVGSIKNDAISCVSGDLVTMIHQYKNGIVKST